MKLIPMWFLPGTRRLRNHCLPAMLLTAEISHHFTREHRQI
ncbi:hypothetical protein GCK32_021043 [Trichostrongylus colubriformis]|uniref:Uncharacterized protein n=1 Tax=Trichostrongylus colubriformis TaxID=6319 RepID=A0AAN8F996_TRICO